MVIDLRGKFMKAIQEVYDFYNTGTEIGRLERGLGKIEHYRTKEIIQQYIKEKSVIYDIGGGIGVYAAWLAKMGHNVHLIELADVAVAFAKKEMMKESQFIAEVGDARNVNRTDESADVVLLLGPLYHLQIVQIEQKNILI